MGCTKLNQIIWSQNREEAGKKKKEKDRRCRKTCAAEMGEQMEHTRRIEIEDFVQNIVERMEMPEAFEDLISREENGREPGKRKDLWEMLKTEWPVEESGERIYQITNIYEETEDEILAVELCTGVHLEHGVPEGHFTLYICREPDGWKLGEKWMMEYLQQK